MRKWGRPLWTSRHIFDLTMKWLQLVTFTNMIRADVIRVTNTCILHNGLPSAKPSLVHCTCPAWLVTSHSNKASPPSCTLTSFGWIRKYCCWPDTATAGNKSVMRAELTVFNQSKRAFQFCVVYVQAIDGQVLQYVWFNVSVRIRVTFRAVRLQYT